MKILLDNRFIVIFFLPFILGSITRLGVSPYNFSIINFITFSTLLFLISIIKKRTKSNYIKKKSNRYFFYCGCSFGFGFFLCGNYWISISLTHDEAFVGLISGHRPLFRVNKSTCWICLIRRTFPFFALTVNFL